MILRTKTTDFLANKHIGASFCLRFDAWVENIFFGAHAKKMNMQKILKRIGENLGPQANNRTGDDARHLRVEGISGDLHYFTAPAPLAVEIAAVLRKQGGCARADIRAAAFSQEELDRHWGVAYALAQIYLI